MTEANDKDRLSAPKNPAGKAAPAAPPGPMRAEKIRRIVEKIRLFLDEKGISYGEGGPRLLEERLAGRRFGFSDHLRALIHAQLSNQTRWTNIAPKIPQIEALFFGYDRAEILKKQGSYFHEGLIALKCGNISTKRQMAHLHHNIGVLERMEKEYGTVDACLENFPAKTMAKMLSEGPYKLKYVGYALAWEYLRNAGIDGAKPDVHLRRMLGGDRLGFSRSPVASEAEAVEAVDRMSRLTGLSRSLIDNLLWNFCADGNAVPCKAVPRCGECPLNRSCGTLRHARNRR